MVTIESENLIKHFMDMRDCVSRMICEFYDIVRKDGNKYLLINFELKKHDGNTVSNVLSILIYGPYNYVGVIYTIRARTASLNIDETWKLQCYHDSCWRTDGVERLIHEYEDQIESVTYFPAIIAKIPSEEMTTKLRKLFNSR